MITAHANDRLELVCPVMILDGGGEPNEVESVIDTGFNAYLALPPALVDELGMPWFSRERVVLGDGSIGMADIHDAAMYWDHVRIEIKVLAMEGTPLIGTALLRGFKMSAVFLPGERAILERVAPTERDS